MSYLTGLIFAQSEGLMGILPHYYLIHLTAEWLGNFIVLVLKWWSVSGNDSNSIIGSFHAYTHRIMVWDHTHILLKKKPNILLTFCVPGNRCVVPDSTLRDTRIHRSSHGTAAMAMAAALRILKRSIQYLSTLGRVKGDHCEALFGLHLLAILWTFLIKSGRIFGPDP